MSDPVPPSVVADSWSHLEHVVERLHAAARSPLGPREFYRRVLNEASSAVGAVASAAWRVSEVERLELIYELNGDRAVLSAPEAAARRDAVLRVAAAREAAIEPVLSPTGKRRRETSDYIHLERLLCPVPQPGGVEDQYGRAPAMAVIELCTPSTSTAMVKQGWLELAATIAEIASDFHALEELRRLREGASLHRQAVELLRRIGGPRDLTGTAFEIANEGRRVLGCDRLSVAVRRGGRWRLLSVSGAARVERRHEFARRMERLADQVARWSEPLEHPAHDSDAEMPPRLKTALEEHVDHSHARELACAPITFAAEQSPHRDGGRVRRRRKKVDAVLIAEQFEGESSGAWRRPLVELAELCRPALARTAALDRFPMRTMLRWSERLAFLRQPARLARTLLICAALAGAVSALVYLPADFNIEAPATLRAAVHRDVFATATGAVTELHVSHGQQVKKGAVLVEISDPELSLKLQQVRGEIEAARKRLNALAVTRTDRTLRENSADDRLPLAAEQRQLEEQVASLELQQKLLQTRREQLTIRSPLAGQVLTRDVEALLESRPVERGQVLLTIADTSSGWELVAEVPQRHVGHVLEAQLEETDRPLVSLKLAGDVERSYPGRVVEISAAAPLEAAGLEDPSQAVPVRIAVTGEPPAAARPGMAASVQIHCGQRALGYVWLHDVAATIYRWITF
jgi:multidrug efflux pump subunit AcrA (membrane-fusion protein)